MDTKQSEYASHLDGAVISSQTMPDGSVREFITLRNGTFLPLDQFNFAQKHTPDSDIPKKPNNSHTCYLARFPNLVDIVEDGGELVFLIVDGDQIKTATSVSIDGKTALPPPREQLPFDIPRWEEVRRAYFEDSPDVLFGDLIAYHKLFSQLPGEACYLLLAAWDFSTYILEALEYSGYIYLYAVPERGKTKTGQAMIYVAYRGIHQENLREADLFRASHDLSATLFIDVADLSKKAYKENSQDILLHRYEKGAKVRRVHHPERGAFKDSRFYDVFGASVIATNEPINEVMESRSFPIDMPYAHKNFPKPSPEIGLPLKERLTAWRAHFLLNKVTLRQPPDFPAGRLNDIAAPLWQIIKLVSPSCCHIFEDFVRECHESRREGKASTIEAEVIKALLELKDEVEDGKIEVDRITDKVNDERKDFHKESARYIGKVLRRLGFQPSRKHASKRRYYYDVELLDNLAVEYGLSDAPADLMSPMSPTSPQTGEDQLQRDMGDIRDVSAENATTDGNGHKTLVLAEYLGDRVYFALDENIAQLAPKGFIVYTLDEVELLKSQGDWMKRMVHEAKKRTHAKIIASQNKNTEVPVETIKTRP